MIEFSEYTPAMSLLVISEISKELKDFDGMNTTVVGFVVAYLIIKLVLDHTSKTNKAKSAEDGISATNQLRIVIKELIDVLKKNN